MGITRQRALADLNPPTEATHEEPMNDLRRADAARRWGELRHAVIGPLLASPPDQGTLHDALSALAAKN